MVPPQSRRVLRIFVCVMSQLQSSHRVYTDKKNHDQVKVAPNADILVDSGRNINRSMSAKPWNSSDTCCRDEVAVQVSLFRVVVCLIGIPHRPFALRFGKRSPTHPFRFGIIIPNPGINYPSKAHPIPATSKHHQRLPLHPVFDPKETGFKCLSPLRSCFTSTLYLRVSALQILNIYRQSRLTGISKLGMQSNLAARLGCFV